MKDFNKFLEEVTIKGNPGIPGEGDKRPEDSDYLADTERRAKERLGVTGREHPGQIAGPLMNLIRKSNTFIGGNEKALEELAYDVIMSNFGDILEGVKLDIKLLKSGKDVADFMDEESDDEQEAPKFKELTDKDTINKIHKAKISNNIIQGESKNTKHILHTQEVKDGIKKIYGDKSDDVFETWDEISKLADKMDWIIPIQIKADMMERQPEGMAGAVSVSWEEDEKEEKEESSDDFAKRILNDLSKGDDPNEDDVEEFTDEVSETTPVIKARGIDFPMLLHESVKGIYELIASVSQPSEGDSPEEIKKAETVKLNVTSFEDEAEDFRTGPEIASDFRDFINENKDSSYSPNMRAFIFGKMMDESYMNTEEFLELFRGILNKTDEARNKVDSMISEIVDDIKKYELGEVLGHDDEESDDEYKDRSLYDPYYDDEEGGEIDYDALGINKPEEEKEEVDYSEMSQRDIQSLIDDALDNGDFKEVEKLSQYLKEGKEIYLREALLFKSPNKIHNRR